MVIDHPDLWSPDCGKGINPQWIRRDFPISDDDDNAKVKLSMRLTKHHAMKAYWGSVGTAALNL
jgi:hypothetical protein